MNDTLNSVDITEAKTIINHLVGKAFKSGDIPPNIYLHGSPGVGKSAIIRQFCEEYESKNGVKVELVDLRASGLEASDVQGIPYVDDGEMKFSTPTWFPQDGTKLYVLFLDELSNASVSVAHAFYRIILDRTIQNGKKMPDSVAIIAAGNLKSDNTGAKPVVPAAANRFAAHLKIDTARLVTPFVNYAVNKEFDPSIIAYLLWKKEAIYTARTIEDAFPTPRSWEYVDLHLKSGLPSNLLLTVIAGAIGSAAAVDFMAFRDVYEALPDWKRIRNGDKDYRFTIDRSEEGTVYAIGVAVGFEVLDAIRSNDKQGVGNLTEMVIDDLPDEIKVVMFRTMTQNIAVMARLVTIPSLKRVFDSIAEKIK